jgi:hypothetical protein
MLGSRGYDVILYDNRVGCMMVRIWSTKIVKGREAAYLKFVREVSMPMFRKQEGLLGFRVLLAAGKTQVLTFWRDTDSMRGLEYNPLYLSMVDSIRAAGFLEGLPFVEIVKSPFELKVT